MNYSIEENILFEDKDIIILYKSNTIAVQHASLKTRDLETMLMEYLVKSQKNQEQQKRGQMPSIYIIHRLDMPVEGVLIFAKTKAAAAALNRQIQTNKIEKKYLAVVENRSSGAENSKAFNLLSGEKHRLINYLVKNSSTQYASVVSKTDQRAKRAELEFIVLEEEKLSHRLLLEIELHTGRFHQIRAQLSNIGLPIVGDTKYNTDKNDESSLALCANHLVFSHPTTGKMVEVHIEPKNPIFKSFVLMDKKSQNLHTISTITI